MSDIKFNCPHCQQRLSVPEAALGRTIACPACTGRIGLPAKKTPPPEQPVPPPPDEPQAQEPVTRLQTGGDIKFACPACLVNIAIAERAAGRQITCQRCGAQILVPGGTPASAPAPSPAVQPSAPPEPTPENIAQLIEKLRDGDAQAGGLLIRMGEAVIPELIEGFRENRLEDPDTNRGADHIVKLLAKCGAICVQPLIAKLGKSRHAYYALGKIGTEDAVNALARELTSVNWRRVEVACKALGLVETQHVLKIIGQIESVRKTTRIGEVFSASGTALAAIQARFPQAQVAGTALQPAKVLQATAPLKVTAAIRTMP